MNWVKARRNDDEEFAIINLAHVVELRVKENMGSEMGEEDGWCVLSVQLRAHEEIEHELFVGTQVECELWVTELLDEQGKVTP